MTHAVPTSTELAAYALGESAPEESRRVRRYLLLSGDRSAVQFVAAVAHARERVLALQRGRDSKSWFQEIVRSLGWRADLADADLASMWRPAPVVLAAEPAAGHVELDRDPDRPWRAVVGLDAAGVPHLLHTGSVAERPAMVAIPHSIAAALVIAAPSALVARSTATPQEVLTIAAARQADRTVTVSLLIVPPQETL